MKNQSMKNQSNNAKKLTVQPEPQQLTDKAVKSIAGTIYKNLQGEGCQMKDIISISSQLLDLVTNELKRDEPTS